MQLYLGNVSSKRRVVISLSEVVYESSIECYFSLKLITYKADDNIDDSYFGKLKNYYDITIRR